MTLRKYLMACASITLLAACAAPNEYRTYETGKVHKTSPISDINWKFWESDEGAAPKAVSKPVDITAPGGRVN